MVLFPPMYSWLRPIDTEYSRYLQDPRSPAFFMIDIYSESMACGLDEITRPFLVNRWLLLTLYNHDLTCHSPLVYSPTLTNEQRL